MSPVITRSQNKFKMTDQNELTFNMQQLSQALEEHISAFNLASLLPSFSGMPEEDVNFFLQQFEDIANLNNWNTQRRLIILKSRLHKDALAYLISEQSLREENNYVEFKRKLQSKFGKEISFNETQNAFLKLKQSSVD